MITDKKQLLLITNKQKMVKCVQEEISMHLELTHAKSLYNGFSIALNLLPDVILLDYSSLKSVSNLKLITDFKSNYFLAKAYLIVYAEDQFKPWDKFRYEEIVDEVLHSASLEDLCNKIIKLVYVNSPLSNFWKEAFLGIFNIISRPVLLLEKNQIIAVNEMFKQSFSVKNSNVLELTDFIKCENVQNVKDHLRNFARCKHIKAATKATLVLKNGKLRNARINFSKLNKNFENLFVVFIDFNSKNEEIIKGIGTSYKAMENCFKENSNVEEFKFTNREKEIIQLLIKGYKTKDISETLFISPKTIEKHRSNIIKRTNSDTILESIIYAINHDLIDYQRVK